MRLENKKRSLPGFLQRWFRSSQAQGPRNSFYFLKRKSLYFSFKWTSTAVLTIFRFPILDKANKTANSHIAPITV